MKNKEKFNKNVNFRTTEVMYERLLKYLKETGDSVSALMRHITYDYLRFKKIIKETKNGKS